MNTVLESIKILSKAGQAIIHEKAFVSEFEKHNFFQSEKNTDWVLWALIVI